MCVLRLDHAIASSTLIRLSWYASYGYPSHPHPLVTVAVRPTVPSLFLRHDVFTSKADVVCVCVCARGIRPDTTGYCRLQRKYELNVHTRAPFGLCHMGDRRFCYAIGPLFVMVPKRKFRSSPWWPTLKLSVTRPGLVNLLERRTNNKLKKRKQWRLSDHHHGTMTTAPMAWATKKKQFLLF